MSGLLPFGAPPAPVKSLVAGTNVTLSPVNGKGTVTINATGSLSSPLTTKGDIWGFSTVDARLPVGTNGFPLMADSGQTLGVGYATRDFDFNGKNGSDMLSLTFGTGIPTNATKSSVLVNYSFSGATTGVVPVTVTAAYTFTSTGTPGSIRVFEAEGTTTINSSVTHGEQASFHSQWGYQGAGTVTNGYGFLAEDVIGDGVNSLTTTTWDAYKAWFTINTPGTMTTLYGFHYAPKSISITPTNEWSFASERGSAYFNGLTTFGGTGAPSGVINITGTGSASPTNLEASFLDSHSRTVSSNVGGAYNWLMNGTTTVTAGQGLGGYASPIGLRETWTLNSAIANFACFDVRSTIAGTTAPSNAFIMYFQPTFNASAASQTITTMGGLRIAPNLSSGTTTVTKYVSLAAGMGSRSSTVTTAVGLDVGVTDPLTGTTLWGMQVGNYNSYHQGKLTVGGTSAPTWNIHMQGGGATDALGFDVATTGPTLPANNAGGVITIYKGASSGAFYLLVGTVFGGTTFYYSLKISTTGNSWVSNGTTLPT